MIFCQLWLSIVGRIDLFGFIVSARHFIITMKILVPKYIYIGI